MMGVYNAREKSEDVAGVSHHKKLASQDARVV